MAKTEGSRKFPWRVIIIEDKDPKLLENNLVYSLARPSKIKNTSWIKPGLVMWDWWHATNLAQVPFESGMNTATFKYYIDFAHSNNIPYVNLDEGWSDQFDLLNINPELDLKQLSDYAASKDVKLILWCVWHTLDKQLTEALRLFDSLNIAGLKVDFIDRNDQLAVEYYERIAAALAEHEMIVNFHGAMNPTGLERAYPNVLTREGVLGMEYNKFNKDGVDPPHNVTLPFIRNVTGPMDYTPGAMRNVKKEWFRPIFTKPISPGTRSHQVAMYIVYYSPLQMLSDAPYEYQKAPDILDFITATPTIWDQTIGLAGKTGKYVITARRNGDSWWIGGMTNYEAREITLDLNFLQKQKKYKATIIKDGINSNKNPTDYQHLETHITVGDTIKIKMASGGGFAIRLTPEG